MNTAMTDQPPEGPGEPAALRTQRFGALLEPVLPLAYGYALRLARQPDDAQDLVQEAALLAFRGFDGFTPGTNFKAWYLRILTNCFYAKYRKQRRAPMTVDLEDAPPLYLMTMSGEAGLFTRYDDPAEALVSRLGVEAVADAIAALPEEFRVVTTLFFLEDQSYQEIAAILDCPLGTVRSRLHRGRRMLQKVLWHLAAERGIVSQLVH